MGHAYVSRNIAIQNEYLALLPEDHFRSLASSMRLIELPKSDLRRTITELPEGFLFPIDCVIALERVVNDQEVGFIRFVGPDELARIDEVSGNRRSRVVRAGCAVIIDQASFFEFALRFSTWPSAAAEFIQARNALALLNSVCYANHSYRQRVARFLLEAQSAFTSDSELPFSHRDIAEMCATRRETVTMVMRDLARHGAVRCRRARVAIVDGEELERLSCVCYREQRGIRGQARKLAATLLMPATDQASSRAPTAGVA